MVMLHRLLHVKQLRFYYANEADARLSELFNKDILMRY